MLLVVYLFNIRALPLFSGERVPFFLVTVVVFLNLGLAGFVLSAIAARFIFPAVSLEGRQMWLLHSSPLDLRALLWSKYWVGTLPLLLLAVFITVGDQRAAAGLGVHDARERRHHVVLFTFAASAMALCFGASIRSSTPRTRRRFPRASAGWCS